MPPIDKQVILARNNGIAAEVEELRNLAHMPFQSYKGSPHFQLAEYHLHRALEGVFNIIAHINSRKAGGAVASGYKEIARKFGELGFIDRQFANENLVKMAGYRNRLVHFYAEIKPEETYELITKHLGDFEVFRASVKQIVEGPEKFGVELE